MVRDVPTYMKPKWDVAKTSHAGWVNNLNLSDIYLDLLKGEENNSSKTDTSPPHVCTSSAQSLNHSRSLEEELLSTQDKEILSILKELENKNDMSNISSQGVD